MSIVRYIQGRTRTGIAPHWDKVTSVGKRHRQSRARSLRIARRYGHYTKGSTELRGLAPYRSK